MSFTLTCHIEIDQYIFESANGVEIESGWASMVQTAIIKLPSKYRLNDQETRMSELIKPGMPVKIELGYDGNLNIEFEGFVSQVLPNTPLEIKCEDKMWTLKREKPEAKSWNSVSLKEVIRHLCPDIEESRLVVDDIIFSPFYIKNNLSKAKALESLKDEYPLVIYFRNGKLFAGKVYQDPDDVLKGHIIYCYHYDDGNVIKPNLTYRRKDDVLLKLKMISHMPDGSKIEYETGDDGGEIRTWNDYNKSLAELKAMAAEIIDKMKFDGYSGSITTFGQPFPQHGQIAEYYDKDNSGQDGWYFIDKVHTFWNESGFRREVLFGRRAGNE